MKKYYVQGYITGSTARVEVEADSPEDAFHEAELHASICYYCSRKIDIDPDIENGMVFDEDEEMVLEYSSIDFWVDQVDSLQKQVELLKAELTKGDKK